MADQDLYAVLGVAKTADADTLKKAYRALAKDLHPDKNPGNKAMETRFKNVNHAYDVLGDEKKRKLYDEFGEDGLREGFNPQAARAYTRSGGRPGGGGGPQPTWDDIFGDGGLDINDVIGDLFGRGGRGRKRGGGQSPKKQRGMDLESEITIDFLAAALGVTLELTSQGAKNDVIKVRIPAGADDGSRVRVAGHGGPSPGGGPNGDLILVVNVKDHPLLHRIGDDLHLDVPISIKEAYHGAKITVPTLEGSVNVKVPPRTQSGTQLRVRGKGIARKGKKEGDLYVHFLVRVPETDAVAALIDKIGELDKEDPRKDLTL